MKGWLAINEIRQIVRLWQESKAAVLVTLVRTAGSSYRQPGARLILGTQGAYAGGISGGCLEAELIRRAIWMVRQGAIVKQYSTMFDDSNDVPFGLGCGGVLDVLMEPANTPECDALLTTLNHALNGSHATVLTWLPGDGDKLKRAILAPDGEIIFASEGLSNSELTEARGALIGDIETLPKEVFVEQAVPPQRLFVFGAGDDAKPLVSMAALLGWRVEVIDGRNNLANRERFPRADRVLTWPLTSAGFVTVEQKDAAVLMTHSYEQDRKFLAQLLPQRPRYLGLLGSKHRSSLLISETAATLGWSLDDCCDRIHAPIGLNLGGDGPEAIALAVIAEVLACCTGRVPVSRRLSARDANAFVEAGEPSRYPRGECALGVA